MNFNQNIKISIVLLIAFLSALSAWAQPGSDLETSEVEIIKNFEASLLEAEKLSLSPTLPPLDTTSQRLIYSVPTPSLSVDYPAPTIRPIAMKAEKLPPRYNLYSKLGFGTPLSPYGELSYQKVFNGNLDVGGQLLHHSANNSKNLDNQRFNLWDGDVYGTYYMDQGFAVSANIGYEADIFHFYGYDHDVESFEREQVKQKLNTFDLGAKFFNGERTQGDLNYYAEVDFSRLNDNYATSESNTILEFGFTKYFNDKHPLSVKLMTDFTNFDDNLETQQLHNYKLQPSFGFHQDRFKVNIGVNAIAHNDNFQFYPMIDATVNILGNRLAAFAGFKGDYEKNNFQNISDYNPFIVSRGIGINNTEYSEIYGGIRGNLKFIEYNGSVRYKDVNNLPLYLTNAADTKRFDVLYDSVKIVNISGTVELSLVKDLSIGGTVSQNIYTMTNEEKPWHLPAFELNAFAKYKALQDKLTVKAELFTANGVPYLDANGMADNLNALFDLNLGASYWINKNIGAFVDVNNLFGNKRERWLRYPMYGLNVYGGVTVRF